MTRDFQIINLLHPHYVHGHGCVYDDVKWTIWISNQNLLNNLNEVFDYDLELNKNNEVRKEVANAVWQYIIKQKKWNGTYGADYDRDILDIYKDLDDDDANRNW